MIEIKGLGNALTDARKAIAEVRAATADVNSAASAFVADAKDVVTQIKKHHSDLLFEVNTLGNSSGESSNSDDKSFHE